MIVLCIEGKEACVEEGTCMEGNRSLSQSLEGWEKAPLLFYIYSCLYRQLDRLWGH